MLSTNKDDFEDEFDGRETLYHVLLFDRKKKEILETVYMTAENNQALRMAIGVQFGKKAIAENNQVFWKEIGEFDPVEG